MVLTESESRLLLKLIKRIIPPDEGAEELKVDQFILNLLKNEHQFWMANDWGSRYKEALSKLSAVEGKTGSSISAFSDKETDSLLFSLSRNEIEGWPDSSVFFELLRTHCICGYLSGQVSQGNNNKRFILSGK
jgi:hypothetical protein